MADVPPIPDDVPPDDEEPTFLDKLRDALIDTAGLDHIPAPEPVIKGILYRNSIAWLQGKSGDGKSFVALDVAGCIGTGSTWQTYPVTQGEVLYIVAEGVTGVRARVRAWEQVMGGAMIGVQWLPVAVQANDPIQWDALIELAREIKPRLVVIDTQARVTVGMEENAAKDMGEFVDRLERLRRASGACVLVVHHQGRNGDHMRGSTALEGAATTVIKVVKEEDEITLSCEKQKDDAPFDEIQLRLVPTSDSATLMPSDGSGSRTNTAAIKTARKWWATFADEKVSVSKLVKGDIAAERSIYRHIRELLDRGLLIKQELGNRNFYWLDHDPDLF